MYKYYWLHIPTGETGEAYITHERLEKEFRHLTVYSPSIYFAINYWNKLGDKFWKYYV